MALIDYGEGPSPSLTAGNSKAQQSHDRIKESIVDLMDAIRSVNQLRSELENIPLSDGDDMDLGNSFVEVLWRTPENIFQLSSELRNITKNLRHSLFYTATEERDNYAAR